VAQIARAVPSSLSSTVTSAENRNASHEQAATPHPRIAPSRLVFLCSPLAHLPLASERSAGIENSCLTVVRFTLEIDRDSVARRKCLFERFVE
jgi:hypothetical protein